MADSLRDRASRALSELSSSQDNGQPDEALDRLRERVAELEREVQECRRLNRRLAELMDVVQELLLPLAQRDEDRLRTAIDRFTTSL